MVSLEGKVVLVTGAARGQGAAEARLCAEAGARVVVTDLREEEGRAVAAGLGGQGLYVRHDVADADSWAGVVREAVAAFGTVSALVNNAALWRTAHVEEQSPEGFEELLRVNLLGPFLGIRAVAPVLRAAGEAPSSTSPPPPDWSAYPATRPTAPPSSGCAG